MKTLFVSFFVGICCFLSACKGHNNLEKHKEVVAGKMVYFFDEETDRLLEKINSQLELADLGATSEAVVYKNLGASYLEQGEPDKAVIAFEKAIQIAPRFVEAHYLLADVYSLKGEGILSRKSLENAMALDGSYIIDIKIGVMDRIHDSIDSTPPAVIRFEEVIELPPEFFKDPDKVGAPREWEAPPK